MKKATPFLKWVGGKNQLLRQFYEHYPSELRRGEVKKYVEPFIGGGAVFFEVMQKFRIPKAYISDLNKDLILAYQTIQKLPDSLLELLSEFQKEFDKTAVENRNELFLNKRDLFNKGRFEINYNQFSDEWIERTAQLIFLNKTCFNGLFRINSKGGFNVPFGKYKKAKILDVANLRRVSVVLKNTEIRCADYKDSLNEVDKNTFVYLDPPYRPISQSSSFTSYTKNGFSDKNQKELLDFIKQIHLIKGAKFMLSNSDPKNINPDDNFFDDLYNNFNIYRVSAGRAVNSNGNKRGKINELLITNFQYEPHTLELNF